MHAKLPAIKPGEICSREPKGLLSALAEWIAHEWTLLCFGHVAPKATPLQAYLLFFMRRDISDWATCPQEDLIVIVNDCN